MGRTEESNDLGDAIALTPSLFLGFYLPHIAHITLRTPDGVVPAVDYIHDGGTVLTSRPPLAVAVMLALGMSRADAMERLNRAETVLPSVQISED